MASPNIIDSEFDTERPEGFAEYQDALSVDLSEEDILEIVGKRVENGEKYWNKLYNLDSVRRKNEQRWKNRNLEVDNKDKNLYEFQTPYRDNRLFVSVETLSANIVAALPDPVVIEAQDTDASRELAENYAKVLRRRLEAIDYKDRLQMVARHLLMGFRMGVQKWYWDSNAGRLKEDGSYTGEAMVKTLRPHKVVLDAGADDPDDVPLIAEYMHATVEELALKFPKHKDEIYKEGGLDAALSPGVGKRLGSGVDYLELWFSYYDKDGNKKEGLCWKMKDILLDSGLNPNYNYDGVNFLERPTKPYVIFNLLNTGKHAIDPTSLLEQASTLQDVLEKRGRQIVENADRANSTKVFNTALVNDSDAQKHVDDPGQIILASGDVNQAFARVPPPILPRYVLEDKLDARREIDNIFGTHAPLRGEKTESPTLGQEVLSQRSDLGRIQALNEALDSGALKVYKGITQLYKVFATEEHITKYVGKDGRTAFIAFSQDKIEDGMEMYIQEGSSMPDEKSADRLNVIELAKLGTGIDPLTLFEKMHTPGARDLAKRVIMHKWLPDRYMSEVLNLTAGEEGQQEAMRDAESINRGEPVQPKENVDKGYLAWYRSFIQSPEFKKLDPSMQQAHIAHMRATVQSAKGALKQGGGEGGEEVEEGAGRQPGLIGRMINRLRGQ